VRVWLPSTLGLYLAIKQTSALQMGLAILLLMLLITRTLEEDGPLEQAVGCNDGDLHFVR